MESWSETKNRFSNGTWDKMMKKKINSIHTQITTTHCWKRGDFFLSLVLYLLLFVSYLKLWTRVFFVDVCVCVCVLRRMYRTIHMNHAYNDRETIWFGSLSLRHKYNEMKQSLFGRCAYASTQQRVIIIAKHTTIEPTGKTPLHFNLSGWSEQQPQQQHQKPIYILLTIAMLSTHRELSVR